MLRDKKELTVIVLAVNETFSLKETIDHVFSFKFVERIYIISPKFVSKACLGFKKISVKYLNLRTIIQSEELPGYGGAIKYCLKFIDTKYFCWIDADGETNPKYIKKMYEIIISNNIDIVNASRFKNNKVLIENYGYISSIFTYAFQLYANFI